MGRIKLYSKHWPEIRHTRDKTQTFGKPNNSFGISSNFLGISGFANLYVSIQVSFCLTVSSSFFHVDGIFTFAFEAFWNPTSTRLCLVAHPFFRNPARQLENPWLFWLQKGQSFSSYNYEALEKGCLLGALQCLPQKNAMTTPSVCTHRLLGRMDMGRAVATSTQSHWAVVSGLKHQITNPPIMRVSTLVFGWQTSNLWFLVLSCCIRWEIAMQLKQNPWRSKHVESQSFHVIVQHTALLRPIRYIWKNGLPNRSNCN